MAVIEPLEPANRAAGLAEPVDPSPPLSKASDEEVAVYPSSADSGGLAAIVGGYHGTPFDILGMHAQAGAGAPAIVIRTFQPQALAVSVIRQERQYPMRRVHRDGLFEAVFPSETAFFPYRFSI